MSQRQHDYNMDRQHLSHDDAYSERTPTATDPTMDLLSNLSDPSVGGQIGYPNVPTTSTLGGTSTEYQSLSSYQQDGYRSDHIPSMMSGMPRYTESSQRPTQQPQLIYSYSPAGSSDMSAHRYPSSTDLYASDMQNAPLSGAYGQGAPRVASVSSMANIRMTDPMVADYRQSMTNYHRRESESLQRRHHPQSFRQHLPLDDRASEHLHAHSPYSQNSPILGGGIDSRRSSGVPDVYPTERTHHGQQQQQQRNLVPLDYDLTGTAQSVGKYPPSGGDNRNLAPSGVLQSQPVDTSGLMQFDGDSYSTSHTSSIPMSNSHRRHLFAGGGVSTAQQPQQSHHRPREDVHIRPPDRNHPEGQHPSHMTHLQQTLQNERQQQYLHQQQHYPARHSPNFDNVANAHHPPRRDSSYRGHADSVRQDNTQSAPVGRDLERPLSSLRAQSMPDPMTSSHHLLRPSSSTLSQSISPLSTSDNESGGESNVYEDDERGGERARRSGKGREDDYSRGQSYDSSGAMMDQEEAQDDSYGGQSRGGGQGEAGQSEPPKKRKKSKMHECPVCQKKFPRPSGLKTHMNTHSNEKPFPCGFPGCTRTFGVRSNAKRHLRTHGIIPTASNTVTETPYVVDFSTPLIMPPHPSSNAAIASPGTGTRAGSASASGVSTDVKMDAEAGLAQDDPGNGAEDLAGGHDRGDRGPSARSAYKVRWVPQSLTTRSNAAGLRSAQDGQRMNTHEWERGQGQWKADIGKGRQEMDSGDSRMDADDDDLSFGDAALAAQLSIPLQPVTPSHASSSELGDNTDADLLQSSAGLSLMGPGDSICVCNPACPQSSDGLIRCRNSGGSSSFTSLSPSNPSTAPPGSASFSSAGSDHHEERNSYLPAGSHPYHPSQHHSPQP